jgi:tripartite-type tricarboxylate transporter receptor subunit TctC
MKSNRVFNVFCVSVSILCFTLITTFSVAQAAESKATAEKFPAKTVRLVITHAAGGITDRPARLIQPFLEKELGISVVIENMAGAGGNIARSYVYKQPPDGYTLLVTQQPSLSSGALVSEGDFDPLKFVPVYNISGKGYQAVGVQYNSPYKNMKDLIEAARKKPMTAGGAGIGANSFIVMTLLNKNAGTKFEYMPFNNTTEASLAVAGGHIDVALSGFQTLIPFEQQKKVRTIAICGPERSELLPNVPTITEQGFPGVEVDQLATIFAPPGLPKDRLDVLNAAFERATRNPEFLKAAKEAKEPLDPMGGEKLRKATLSMHQMIQSIAPALLKEMKK